MRQHALNARNIYEQPYRCRGCGHFSNRYFDFKRHLEAIHPQGHRAPHNVGVIGEFTFSWQRQTVFNRYFIAENNVEEANQNVEDQENVNNVNEDVVDVDENLENDDNAH